MPYVRVFKVLKRTGTLLVGKASRSFGRHVIGYPPLGKGPDLQPDVDFCTSTNIPKLRLFRQMSRVLATHPFVDADVFPWWIEPIERSTAGVVIIQLRLGTGHDALVLKRFHIGQTINK